MDNLLHEMKKQYQFDFLEIEIIREWIGKVFLVKTQEEKYVLKLFKNNKSGDALITTPIMDYLYQEGVQVPKVIKTVEDELGFVYKDQTAILLEYIDGMEVEASDYLKQLGEYAGMMRSKMESYTGKVNDHGKEFFIDRYLNIMRNKKYKKVKDFEDIADFLWSIISDSTKGFIHGDFHAGNMFLRENKLVAFDFDAASYSYPYYDIATACDASDYFSCDENNFEKARVDIKNNVKEFMRGYSKYFKDEIFDSNKCDDYEKVLHRIYACVAMRHYDIQATIIEALGEECVDSNFLDNQLNWLLLWKKHCLD